MNNPWWVDPNDETDGGNNSTNGSLYLEDDDSERAVRLPTRPKSRHSPPKQQHNKKELRRQQTASTATSDGTCSDLVIGSSPERKPSSARRSKSSGDKTITKPSSARRSANNSPEKPKSSRSISDGKVSEEKKKPISAKRNKSDSTSPKRSSSDGQPTTQESKESKPKSARRSKSDSSNPEKPRSNRNSEGQQSQWETSIADPKRDGSNEFFTVTRSSSETRSTSGQSSSSSNADTAKRYTVSELVSSLGERDIELPPALERRVRDFKFAQSKRRERHGDNRPWGIFGLYQHLSDIRADLEWAEDAAWRRQRGEPYLSWSDFEKTRDEGIHNRPWFTYGVIALCSLMMLVTFGVNDWKIEPLSVNPLIGPSAETLIKCGARQTNLIVNEGEWYRLFTPLILHAGLIHYVINMLAMWYVGAAVENAHGFASAAVLFIIPAVGGNILSAICLPQYITVGASGGIFGLIGGCVADISINWNLLFLKTTTDEDTRLRHFMVLFWLAIDVFVNTLIGFTPFVDNFTHLGGFMYGLCCGLSTIERLAVGFFGVASGDWSRMKNTFMRFFGLIVSVVTIMVTTVVLVQSDGVSSPCHGCRYISCVPFPFSAEDKWWYCDDCDSVTADLFVAANGSGLYEQIELKCPDGSVEEIVISQSDFTDKEEVRRELPSYCRAHCEDVFISN